MNSSLRDLDGYLPLLAEYVDKHAKMEGVATELHAQVDKAQAAGIKLSHLDGHMGTLFTTPQLLGVYLKLGKDYHLHSAADKVNKASGMEAQLPAQGSTWMPCL